MSLIYTCGDPLSINIEAFLRVVAPSLGQPQKIIGIGSTWQLNHQAQALKLPVPKMEIIKQISDAKEPGIFWLDPWRDAPQKDAKELSEMERGKMAVLALESIPPVSSTPLAVLTAPINKKNAAIAEFQHPGQTEFFEKLWNSRAVMMLAGPKLRVALATNHLRLQDVPTAITKEIITTKITVAHESAKRLFGMTSPRIAVCGLNPHCSDGGLFGDEESRVIAPAIAESKARSINVSGPFPADTVFYRALKGEFDLVLAMYHDQGLGPLKTIHFDEAVNISMGLPFLRVSPDHGPAADLYLTGRASLKSFNGALTLCQQWLNNDKVT